MAGRALNKRTHPRHVLSVLGMDPALSNWGFAFGRYNISTGELRIHDLQLARTQKSAHKQVRVSSDDLARAALLAEAAFSAAKSAQVVFVEVPTGSQSARAMASYGIAVGILASMRSQYCPFIELSPTAIKLATVGDRKASKQRIILRAVQQWPDLPWPRDRSDAARIVTAQCEHLADAIGAVEAGIKSDEFQQLIAVHGQSL